MPSFSYTCQPGRRLLLAEVGGHWSCDACCARARMPWERERVIAGAWANSGPGTTRRRSTR
eukprot:9876277-Alexandrium_andersonii.AAC.1